MAWTSVRGRVGEYDSILSVEGADLIAIAVCEMHQKSVGMLQRNEFTSALSYLQPESRTMLSFNSFNPLELFFYRAMAQARMKKQEHTACYDLYDS